MKYLPNIAGGVLGFIFSVFGIMYFLKMLPNPPAPPEGSPIALFMGAFVPTGYLDFVKALEVIGGVLVAIPRTRNWGLLVLGPIIVNILAFTHYVAKDEGFLRNPNPVMFIVVILAAYLLWVERKAFLALLR